MFEEPLVMLDFETTGLSPDAGARIIEVAALRIVNGRIADRFVSLVNCGARVPPFITALTGITQQMVDAAPSAQSIMPALLHFIGNATVAAHNAGFDEKFLLAESRRHKLAPAHCRSLCTLKLARRIFPGMPSYKLSRVAPALGINFRSAAHRAEADAEVTVQLLLHIVQHLKTRHRISVINTELLQQINSLSPARAGIFLRKNRVDEKTAEHRKSL